MQKIRDSKNRSLKVKCSCGIVTYAHESGYCILCRQKIVKKFESHLSDEDMTLYKKGKLKRGTNKMIWEKIDKKFWKPEKENETIEGLIKGVENTQYGNAIVIETDEETILVNYTALKSLEQDIGQKVKIVYNGEIKASSGMNYKDFSIFRWKD